METINDLESTRTKCPVCSSTVNEIELGRAGLTNEQIRTLRRHIKEETFGLLVQLVDITMRKIDPDKLGLESEMKRAVAELQRTIESVNQKLDGTAIGKIGEIITIKDLKAVVPSDEFSEENAAKGGTDIIATIKENSEAIGKIAISVKYDLAWKSEFITQLNKNMKQEGTNFGILVTKDFPRESLSDKAYVKERAGGMILVVKPEYVSVAYSGYRLAVIAELDAKVSIRNMQERLEKHQTINKAIVEWIGGEGFMTATHNIDNAIENSNKTTGMLNNIEKYVVREIGKAKDEQDSLRQVLENSRIAVQDLKNRLNQGEKK